LIIRGKLDEYVLSNPFAFVSKSDSEGPIKYSPNLRG
jgi:hypothetical protein